MPVDLPLRPVVLRFHVDARDRGLIMGEDLKRAKRKLEVLREARTGVPAIPRRATKNETPLRSRQADILVCEESYLARNISN